MPGPGPPAAGRRSARSLLPLRFPGGERIISPPCFGEGRNVRYVENALRWEDYLALRESVGWTRHSRARAQRAIGRSLYIVTAAEGDQAVGMGRLVGDGIYYLIADVAVHPLYQRRGIGGKIMEMLIGYVEKETPAGGRASIQLIAEPGKEPFYEAMGFERIPGGSCGPGMRKVICQ